MARLVRTVVLVAIAALFANTQCYAQCLASLNSQSASASAHSGCHHSSSSKKDSHSQCNDEHQAKSATLEDRVDLAKLGAVSLAPSMMLLSTAADSYFGNRWLVSNSLPERAARPDKPLFLSISILRL